MREYKTEFVSVERNKLVSCKCDICKNEIEEGLFEKKETTVEMVVGKRYPECGNSITTSYDICVDCFLDKLMPWLAEQGAESRKVEAYW